MATDASVPLYELLQKDEGTLVQHWVDAQINAPSFRSDRISRQELTDQSRRFMTALREAVRTGESDIMGPAWAGVRQMLDDLSVTRAQHGFSPSETASFIFSLKQPILDRLQAGGSGSEMLRRVWSTNMLLDRLGLYTTEVFQRGREQVIIRQQQELMELSTPVVTLWEGVLALPLIGTLDSARTQVVMENLLQRIVDSGAAIAIIDITGVPTVDTVTAQHLLKTVAAARLMGADCIISGIRPQIAQTIVHLGVELGSVVTKATLADAFGIALRRLGLAVQKQSSAPRRRDDEGPDGRAAADRGEA
ncbi:MAG: STAS domain-containing protein [Vicinamibacterales bacterium]